MNKFECLKASQIDAALASQYRQYLTGKLEIPQPLLPCISDDIEIGISKYSSFTADKPHIHPIATEHCYVLEGSIKLLLLDGSYEEHQFNKGDIFVLRPKVGYATKNAADTKILFIKSPGGNDKQLVEIDEKTQKWLSSWE